MAKASDWFKEEWREKIIAGQNEEEFSDWDEWMQGWADEYGGRDVAMAMGVGLAAIQDEEMDSTIIITPLNILVNSETSLLSYRHASKIRRAGSAFSCWLLQHVWVITAIDYPDLLTEPTTEPAKLALKLSRYSRPRVLRFSVQCVRCGRLSVEEMVQASTVPIIAFEAEQE